MKILIDVDDVLVDSLSEVLRLYNADYKDSLTREDIKTWDMLVSIKPECGKKIYEYWKKPDLYRFLRPIQGALGGVDALRDAGHSISFVTANTNPGIQQWLRAWHFLDIGESAIVSTNKKYVDGDIIVDDKPATVASFPGYGILFDRPHNRDIEWEWRAHGWRPTGGNGVVEIVQMLEGLRSLREDTSRRILDEKSTENTTFGGGISGVGQDTPMTVNEKGGKQAYLPYRFDLVDPLTIFKLAEVLATGAEKYGEWNWRRLSVDENLNHALMHIYAHLALDGQDDHLEHAFCRLMFALSVDLTPDEVEHMKPSD